MKLRLTAHRVRTALSLSALLGLHGGALAAEPATAANDQLPKILQGIPRATGECRVEPGKERAGGAVEVKPDMSCGLPMSGIRTILQRADTVMIDVRDARDYEAFHIEGALQASLADVRSKPYWRGKTVVLVGSGKAENELYSACANLKKSYKQVLVLRGGVPAWLAAGQPVLGRAPAAAQMMRLSAADFWLESQHGDNLIVLDKQQAALQSDIPFSMVLPDTSAAAIKSMIEQRNRALKSGGPASVVLASAPQFSDQQLASLQMALAPVPLLVYSDTRDAFRAQQRSQKAILLAQAHGPKQLGCGL